jgi:hypothetical protein
MAEGSTNEGRGVGAGSLPGTSASIEVLGSWLHYREVGASEPVLFPGVR